MNAPYISENQLHLNGDVYSINIDYYVWIMYLESDTRKIELSLDSLNEVYHNYELGHYEAPTYDGTYDSYDTESTWIPLAEYGTIADEYVLEAILMDYDEETKRFHHE